MVYFDDDLENIEAEPSIFDDVPETTPEVADESAELAVAEEAEEDTDSQDEEVLEVEDAEQSEESEEADASDVDLPDAYIGGGDGYIAFVRHGHKILLMRRAPEVADFAGCWDGIYGVGSAGDAGVVARRIEDATGIPLESLKPIRSGQPRGIDFGDRLYEITPWLFESSVSAGIEPKALYDGSRWVDTGFLNVLSPDEIDNWREESVLQARPTFPQLDELFGDVGSFLYMLKTTIGQEQKIAQEILARLSGTGSLQETRDEVFSVIHPHTMRGYIFIEATAKHHVEKVIGRAGGVTTPLRGCSKVLPGEAPLEVVFNYLEPKAATEGLEEGQIVEIRVGHFKGQRARVTAVLEGKEEVTVELFDAPVPIPITMRADNVRVTERVGE